MERSIFEDNEILDDLIVGYCVIFNRNDDLLLRVSWDDYSDTNDSSFAQMTEPGLQCSVCPTTWSRVAPLRRFGDQAWPQCGDLYPGVNREP